MFQNLFSPWIFMETPLLKLCHAREWEKVRERIKTHPFEALPNPQSDRTTTALSVACRSQAPCSIIKLLVQASTDQLYVKHRERGTVLHDSIKHSAPLDVSLYVIFQQKSCNQESFEDDTGKPMNAILNARDNLGHTPLHILLQRLSQKLSSKNERLCHEGILKLARELIKSNPQAILLLDQEGQTPLSIILSIVSTHDDMEAELFILEILRIMFRYNPDAANSSIRCERSTKNDETILYTPLSYALHYGRSIATIRLLVELAPEAAAAQVGYDREFPLHIAITNRASLDVINLLLEAAPHVALSKDASQLTPFCWVWITFICDQKKEPSSTVIADACLSLERRFINNSFFEATDIAAMRIGVAVKHGSLRNNHQDVNFSDDLKLLWLKMEALIIAVQNCNVLKGIQCLHRKKVQCCVLHAANAIPFLPSPILSLALFFHGNDLMQKDGNGKLPLHHAASRTSYSRCLPIGIMKFRVKMIDDSCSNLSDLLHAYPKAATVWDNDNRLPLHISIENNKCGMLPKDDKILKMIQANMYSFDKRDGVTGLFPFMLTAVGNNASLDTTYEILRECPVLIQRLV